MEKDDSLDAPEREPHRQEHDPSNMGPIATLAKSPLYTRFPQEEIPDKEVDENMKYIRNIETGSQEDNAFGCLFGHFIGGSCGNAYERSGGDLSS